MPSRLSSVATVARTERDAHSDGILPAQRTPRAGARAWQPGSRGRARQRANRACDEEDAPAAGHVDVLAPAGVLFLQTLLHPGGDKDGPVAESLGRLLQVELVPRLATRASAFLALGDGAIFRRSVRAVGTLTLVRRGRRSLEPWSHDTRDLVVPVT